MQYELYSGDSHKRKPRQYHDSHFTKAYTEHQWGESSSRFQREKPNSKQVQQERGFRARVLGGSQKSEELHESW